MRLRVKPLQKKELRCLGCGRTMWTDAAHRFCARCRRRNREAWIAPTYSAGATSRDRSP